MGSSDPKCRAVCVIAGNSRKAALDKFYGENENGFSMRKCVKVPMKCFSLINQWNTTRSSLRKPRINPETAGKVGLNHFLLIFIHPKK